MADTAKYAPINGGTLVSDLKSHFSFGRTKRTVTCAYGFTFVFIAFTIFLAFSPSPNASSPWFTNIFSLTGSSRAASSSSSSSTIFSDESYRSHFSSIFSYFFPNSSQPHNYTSPISSSRMDGSKNTTLEPPHLSKKPPTVNNRTQSKDLHDKVEVLKPSNQSTVSATKSDNQTVNPKPNSSVLESSNRNVTLASNSSVAHNGTVDASSKSSSELKKGSSAVKNQTQSKDSGDKGGDLKTNLADQKKGGTPEASSGEKRVAGHGEKGISEKSVMRNFTSSLSKKQGNETNSGVSAKQGSDDLVRSLMNCNLFEGNWVKDDSYPLYKPGSCSLIDEQFNCFLNGRPDNNYYKLRWKPHGCSLPRFDGAHMLELLRGKRLVFVGDSLNRNMWESLVCILRNSVKDQRKVYEAFGRLHFRGEASYSFVFEDYKCTVEFFVSPFLVQEWETTSKNGTKKETLRLDLIARSADKYKNADIIVFNTGHWWTHEKTSLGKDYYQEGSHVYSELNVNEALRKALTTWGRWVDANINPAKSLLFFRGYSASHFSGGQWNSGGQCDHETEPIKNETYLSQYPSKMAVLEKVLRGMKTHVSYLNITRMTDYRKDGHPSMYRKQNLSAEERKSPLMFQDCSHWCLPGVPDAWNDILYAQLLVRESQRQQQQKKT